MSGQGVDFNQTAVVRLTHYQWNGVLMCLRTGNGQAFTWESTNPLIAELTRQLQAQMAQPQAQLQTIPAQWPKERGNGEDHTRQGEDGQGISRIRQRDTEVRFEEGSQGYQPRSGHRDSDERGS